MNATAAKKQSYNSSSVLMRDVAVDDESWHS